MADPLLIDHTEGVATLTLNRPEAMNALNIALKESLRDALIELNSTPGVRAVVLTGAGERAFCVGQDLREHLGFLQSGDPSPLGTVAEHYNPLVTALAALSVPVIAAVRGAAAGAGASLALLADFRIGGPSTSLLMAFAKVGIAGDSGISWTLPRLVGQAKALELLLLAEPVGAAEAHRLGLLTRVAETDGEILPAAQELAARLAAGQTIAYGAIKRELAIGSVGTLAEALASEAAEQALCGGTRDHVESTMAFVEKRTPTFIGS